MEFSSMDSRSREPSSLDAAIYLTDPAVAERLRALHGRYAEQLAESHLTWESTFRTARLARFGSNAMVPIFRECILEKVLAEASQALTGQPISMTDVVLQVSGELEMDITRIVTVPFVFDATKDRFMPDYDQLRELEGSGLDVAFCRAYEQVRDWCSGVEPIDID